MLSIAGADLDAVNAGPDGSGPLFRLSGTHVKINVASKTRAPRGFDHDEGVRGCLVHHRGCLDQSRPEDGVESRHGREAARVPAVPLRVAGLVRVRGTVGVFDFFTLLVNLAVAMGMLGVAVTVVDAASEYLVSNFDDQKYDDRNDFMTLEALKEYALEQGDTGQVRREDGDGAAGRRRDEGDSRAEQKSPPRETKVADETCEREGGRGTWRLARARAPSRSGPCGEVPGMPRPRRRSWRGSKPSSLAATKNRST